MASIVVALFLLFILFIMSYCRVAFCFRSSSYISLDLVVLLLCKLFMYLVTHGVSV